MVNPKLRFKKPDGTAYPDWEEKRLGECFTERVERSKGNEELLSVSINNGVTRQSEGAKRDASSEDKKNYKVVHVGDIAYNTMRMWQGAEGRSPFDGIVSPAYTIVVPVQGVADSCFFEQFFKNGRMIKTFERHSQGLTSDTWNLKFDAFSKIKVMVPSIEEQGRVVEGLASVDEKIEAQEQYVAALETQKKKLLRQVFAREIRFKDENGQDYPEWEERTVSGVSDVSGGKTPSMDNHEYWDDPCVNWVSSKDVKRRRLSKSEMMISEKAASTMRVYAPGTVLIVVRSGILKRSLPITILEANSTINQDIKAFVVHGCSNVYFSYCLEAKEPYILRDLVKTGTTVQSVKVDDLLDMPIPIPSIPEQQHIADFFTALDAQIENERALLEDWRQLKKGLLQQMFV